MSSSFGKFCRDLRAAQSGDEAAVRVHLPAKALFRAPFAVTGTFFSLRAEALRV
jgi:hypothetical protein